MCPCHIAIISESSQPTRPTGVEEPTQQEEEDLQQGLRMRRQQRPSRWRPQPFAGQKKWSWSTGTGLYYHQQKQQWPATMQRLPFHPVRPRQLQSNPNLQQQLSRVQPVQTPSATQQQQQRHIRRTGKIPLPLDRRVYCTYTACTICKADVVSRPPPRMLYQPIVGQTSLSQLFQSATNNAQSQLRPSSGIVSKTLSSSNERSLCALLCLIFIPAPTQLI